MPDVVIVGAGIIGSAIALALRARGASVLLLERAVPGAESSSAAAGMLAPQLEAHAPDPSFELGLASRALYPAWTAKLTELTGLDVGYEAAGAIMAFPSEEALEAAERAVQWQRGRELRLQRIDRSALASAVPGVHPRLVGALHFPDEAQVDPRALMRALSRATQVAGAEHLSGSTVSRVIVEGGRARGVELEDRTIHAGAVVIAAGAWSGLLEGAGVPRRAVRPARGQMLALDAGCRPFAPYLWTPEGYLVPRRDGRVVVGATMELVGYSKQVTAGGLAQLLNTALSAVPALADAPLLESWSGLRPYTVDGLPLLGRGAADGVFVATGHHRNGILQAPITGELLADLISGGTPSIPLEPFSPTRRFDFA